MLSNLRDPALSICCLHTLLSRNLNPILQISKLRLREVTRFIQGKSGAFFFYTPSPWSLQKGGIRDRIPFSFDQEMPSSQTLPLIGILSLLSSHFVALASLIRPPSLLLRLSAQHPPPPPRPTPAPRELSLRGNTEPAFLPRTFHGSPFHLG